MNSRTFKIGTLRCGMKKRAPATILNFCPDFSSSGKSLDRCGNVLALLTEAIHSLGIFTKSLNESCESKAVCFLTSSTALDFESPCSMAHEQFYEY